MGDSDHKELVAQLYQPKTRRTARQKLVAAGAVDALIECLDARNESVVWAAVESLGELRAAEAVGPLADLLDKGILIVDVCEALTQITGQDFEADTKKWRQWVESDPAVRKSNLDVAECVQKMAELLGVEAIGAGASYQFKLTLPNGRTQKVALFCNREDDQGQPLVLIYSECGPANPKHYEALLRKNVTMPTGAFAVRDVDETPNVVVVDTLFASSATPGILAKKVENIAQRADIVEKSLTKEDRR